MNDRPRYPRGLTAIILICAWMTYRSVGLAFLPRVEAFGGTAMPSAWMVPLGQDALIGLTAPLVAYLVATRPRVATLALTAAWLWWGISDFVVGIVVESYYPPVESPFGPHTPEVMMQVWLYANLAIEVVALVLLATKDVRDHFTEGESRGPIAVSASPLGGRWMILIFVAVLIAVFFGQVAALMDGAFALFV